MVRSPVISSYSLALIWVLPEPAAAAAAAAGGGRWLVGFVTPLLLLLLLLLLLALALTLAPTPPAPAVTVASPEPPLLTRLLALALALAFMSAAADLLVEPAAEASSCSCPSSLFIIQWFSSYHSPTISSSHCCDYCCSYVKQCSFHLMVRVLHTCLCLSFVLLS